MRERITFYIVKDDSNNGMYLRGEDVPVEVEVIECTGRLTDLQVLVDEKSKVHFSYRTQITLDRAKHRTAAAALDAYCVANAKAVDDLTAKMNRVVARSHKAALLLMSPNAGKTEVTK